MAFQEAPERRNFYRRFMSTTRYDHGWLTGPVYGMTVQIPGLAGWGGLIHFSGQTIKELTQERPLLFIQALETINPAGSVIGMSAIREILETGNLEQAGLYSLATLASVGLMAGAGFLSRQAELGLEDGRKAERKEMINRQRTHPFKI